MTEKKHLFGMRAEERERLLQSMRGAKPEPRRDVTPQYSPDLTNFATLPQYTQVQVEKAVCKKLGIEEPYYICHDGLSQEVAHINGRAYVNFSCYDYLGLNGDPRIMQAVQDALARYGVSASASRLTAGERPPHRALEEALAAIYGTEDCLCFVSGHGTNVSTIASVMGSRDVIFYDQASHNSLIMGAALSQAARFSYPNNDCDALEQSLRTHRASFQRAMIVTEGLFGMDGVITNLPRLLELKEQYACFLMVDEAHSLGTVGKYGHGVGEHFGIHKERVDIWMGTLSKTLCGCGGYIAGTKALIDILRYEAPGFVYSVGMPPLLACASLCALDCMEKEPWRVAAIQEKSQTMLSLAHEAGLDTGKADGYAVIPILVGDSVTCVLLAAMLKEEGILTLPIIYPGVQEGRARLRFFVSARHTDLQIKEAIATCAKLLPRARANAKRAAG
ncbi:MAG: aminotransferase class I/II-fold pyridoxal phosphate-dependent enzyme [Desulfovibrio sp.]|nr:aminotransferase class I/II-fold pyridoxal phosphate-dependent enzyme [Desulfovibrio sp.]